MIILGAIAEGVKKIKHYNCRKGNMNLFNRLNGVNLTWEGDYYEYNCLTLC